MNFMWKSMTAERHSLKISFKDLPTKELNSFAHCVARLSSNLSKRALEAAHKESSKQLIKHYGLPEKGMSKKMKPSTSQLLKTNETTGTLEAQDAPLSLLRFVVGSKKFRMKNIPVKKRKGLKLSIFPGTYWKTKKAFSAVSKGNMHLFNRVKIKGKEKTARQTVPSAYNVLTHDEPLACIRESLFDALGKDTFEMVRERISTKENA